MSTVADIIRDRFVSVNSEYQSYSGSKKYAEPSKIRIEQKLQNGVGQYFFNIKKTDINNQYEQSLDRNDVFYPTMWGLFLALRSQTKPSTEVLMSFPHINDGANPSVHAVGFQNSDVEAVYNGKLKWLIDNGVLLNAYPTEKFRKVPEQQGAFVLNTADAAVNEQIQTEWCLEKACDFLTPKFTIAGTRDHNISVNFDASGLTFPVTSGYDPYLVLYMDGFLVKGGCEFIDSQNPNANAVGMW